MLKNLTKKLTNNLGLKLLAVLFAIALWIVVVNIDDPVKPAQYTISVTQDNMDYLTSNGKSQRNCTAGFLVSFWVWVSVWRGKAGARCGGAAMWSRPSGATMCK